MTTATTHPTPTNPNHPPVPSGPEQHTGEDLFEFLDVDALQDLRDAQNDLIERESQGLHPLDTVGQKIARERAMAQFDDLRHEYLQDRMNINEHDPDYADCFDYVAQVSVDNMSDHDWYVGEYDADGNKVNPSGRQMIQEFHDKSLQDYKDYRASLQPPQVARGAASVPVPTAPAAPVAPPMPSPNSDPTIVSADMLRELHDRLETGRELLTDLHEARDRLAQMALDHQGRLLGGRASEEYKQALDTYNQAMISYGKFREQQIDPHDSRTQDEKNASVVGYLLKEAAELRTLTNEKWENTKVGKICKWMAKGNWFQRTLKGVAIGAGVSGAVAIVTAATAGTGTVGIIAGGAGTVATMATRLMRGYGAVRGRQGGMAEGLTPAEQAELVALVDTHSLDTAAMFSSEKYVDNVETERGKNRKAAAWSIGAVAMGAGGAEVAHLAVEHSAHYVEHLSNAWDRVRSAFGHKPDTSGGKIVGRFMPGQGTGTGTGTGTGPNGLPNPGGVDALVPSNPNAQHLFTPESFQNGVNVPLHHGDGIYRLSDRYGLSHGQQEKLMHVLSQRHDGTTYWENGDLRLNYHGGNLHLSPKELQEVFSVH